MLHFCEKSTQIELKLILLNEICRCEMKEKEEGFSTSHIKNLKIK